MSHGGGLLCVFPALMVFLGLTALAGLWARLAVDLARMVAGRDPRVSLREAARLGVPLVLVIALGQALGILLRSHGWCNVPPVLPWGV